MNYSTIAVPGVIAAFILTDVMSDNQNQHTITIKHTVVFQPVRFSYENRKQD